MADKSSGLSIEDMDFGEFLDTDEGFATPEVPEKEGTKEGENKGETEEPIDVNQVLEEQTSVEEEEKEDEGGENKNLQDPPASDQDEPLSLVLARYQLEQGVLSSVDEEKIKEIAEKDGDAAALSFIIQNEVDANSKAVTEKLDDYSKEYIELRKLGFDSTDAGNAVMTLESLDGISEDELQKEENEDLRRMILKENYKATTRFSESKIDRLVKRAFDINADVEDAVEALDSLKEAKKSEIKAAKEEQQKAQQKAEEEYKQQMVDLQKYIDTKDEFIPGKKINKQTKSKIFDLITKPIKQSEDGYAMNAVWAKRAEDPIAFDATITYLYLSGVFDGKWDQITKSVTTDLTRKLEQKLKSGGAGYLGGKHTIQKTPSEEARENMIGPMKDLFK